jgi:hypothetical protein
LDHRAYSVVSHDSNASIVANCSVGLAAAAEDVVEVILLLVDTTVDALEAATDDTTLLSGRNVATGREAEED